MKNLVDIIIFVENRRKKGAVFYETKIDFLFGILDNKGTFGNEFFILVSVWRYAGTACFRQHSKDIIR